MIRVQTLSGGELVIQDEARKGRATICSAAKASRYLQHGCMGFLAYVTESQAEKKRSAVPVVREFPDVFPEDLPGISSDRKVEFWIDLVLGRGVLGSVWFGFGVKPKPNRKFRFSEKPKPKPFGFSVIGF